MKSFYSVCEDYEGKIHVSSHFGNSLSQEKKYAKTMNRKVHHVTSDYDEAQRLATTLRSFLAAEKGGA